MILLNYVYSVSQEETMVASDYLSGFFNHKLFDLTLFNDFKNMNYNELFAWHKEFFGVLNNAVPFSQTWNGMVDIQKAYFNSWLALNSFGTKEDL
jgi:hypothetical protein